MNQEEVRILRENLDALTRLKLNLPDDRALSVNIEGLLDRIEKDCAMLEALCAHAEQLRNGLLQMEAQAEEISSNLAKKVLLSQERPCQEEKPLEALSDEPARESSGMEIELEDLLKVAIKHKSSDLHLKAGSPPVVRIHGELVPIGETAMLASDTRRMILQILTPEMHESLMQKHEIDFSYECQGRRFRVNAFLQKGTVSASFRLVQDEIPGFEELHLPPVLKDLTNIPHGLILVTGPTGCGKSTTLAAMIEYMNATRKIHIVTIEDPIEFVYQDRSSIITQREVGIDTKSYLEALKMALRQDPDVILVGEMRNPETILTATMAAETGHLVLSTLHTPNCVQAINRILDYFSGEQQRQFRISLAGTLRAIVSQKLIRKADGLGRVPAVEVLVVTSTISSLILESKIGEIYPYLVDGASEGMQTFSDSLIQLYKEGLIGREDAIYHADRPTEVRLALEGHVTNTGPEARSWWSRNL